MPNYYLWTIGCQMNKAESERLASFLEQLGYSPVARAEEADLVLLNSCVIRASAESKVTNKLAALRALKKSRPAVKIAVTGCLVESDLPALQHRFPQVDHFFKPGELPHWLAPAPRPALPEHPGPSTYVPIIYGCDNFCAYCIVPYRRGREQSRPRAEIVAECAELVRRGAREIVLLGQNVDSYGHDLPGAPGLADLLTDLDPIPGLARVGFLTNHPKDMSPRLIAAVAKLKKTCRYLNLPVQSGSDKILEAMRRGYDAARYRALVAAIRAAVPDMAITTDVIVGFPGETEADFAATMSLLQDLRFDLVHVAAYSPRPGTIAARELTDDVPTEVKAARLQAVEALQAEVAGAINAGLAGSVFTVLVNGRQGGKWRGRTITDKIVFFNGDGKDYDNKLVPVRITKTSPWALSGEAVSGAPADIEEVK